MALNQEEAEVLYQRGQGRLSDDTNPCSGQPADYDVECGSHVLDESSEMLHTDQSMDPPPYGVDEMEYEEVIDLMKYLNIKSTESGGRDRSLLNDYLYNKRWIGSYEDKIQDTVNKTMKKYVAEKNRLHKSYLEIEKMAKTDEFRQEIGPILEERFPKYMEQLQKRITKLTTDEIEICIIGCTCAGKSTFFNILLGEDIMPTNVLPDTPCLVRLHNSQTRKIQFVAEDKTLTTVLLTDDPRDTKCKLKAILDQTCGSDQTLDVVDLYWPIPRLHENVVFVDTPGIGEKNSLTQLVIKHVPNAAGYICIINSGDGGGILEGGIVHLFKAIANIKGQTEDKLGNVLFICNKWDMIKRQDRETVSEDTRRKLKLYFDVVEDWQIIHFSASVELQLMHLRASPTADFLKILEGLERLMSGTIKNLFSYFFGWIKSVIGKSVGIIEDKMLLLSLSTAELVELTTKTAKVLEDTEIKLESNSKKIETMVGTKKYEIIKDLQQYLKCSWVQQRAGKWKYTDLMSKFSDIVLERIHMLISEWAENDEGLLKKAISDTEKECRQFADDIQTCLCSVHKLEMDYCFEHTDKVNMKPLRILALGFLTESAAITTIATAAILFSSETALVTATAILCPLALVLTASITVAICIAREKDKLTKLTLETLEKFSSNENTENLISTLFELPFTNWIKQFRSTLQCEIASQRKLVQELSSDVHCETDHMSTLVSLFHKLNIFLMDLEKIDVEYYSNNSVSCECLCIDSSLVSATKMFHLHDVSNLVEGKRFTLRVIDPSYSGFHLQAIPKMKKMKNTNFMSPEGVVYSTSILDEEKACGCSIYSLKLLIQKSIGHLEQYVFSNQSMQGSYSGESTEGFFQKMTLGIANGLSYVHEMGLVHGHLQLSSILLAEDMTPKLCDINILPTLQERNCSKCIFHTAPEVIRGEEYGSKADIYSLGILLWELWYGRHTPPNMNLTMKSVCNGVRPKFEKKYPKKVWIDMIKSCWTDSPDRRPSAAACVRISLNVV